MFLHSSYFNVDTAYDTIVVNCKYRKELPQVFANYDPSSEEMKKVFETMWVYGKSFTRKLRNQKSMRPRQYNGHTIENA